MSRAIWLFDALQSLPPSIVAIFAVLTWLGSVPVLIAGCLVWSWTGDRRSAMTVLGAVLVAAGVTVALKTVIGLPRPPATMQLTPADGYGFPSGHALAATVGWGASALSVDRGRWAVRIGVACSVIVLVALSRVVLGVHFTVDVIAGIAVGLVVLGTLWILWHPRVVFGISVLTAGSAVLLTQASKESVLLLGLTLGAVTVLTKYDIPDDSQYRFANRELIVMAATLAIGFVVAFSMDSLLVAGFSSAAMGAVMIWPPPIRKWLGA